MNNKILSLFLLLLFVNIQTKGQQQDCGIIKKVITYKNASKSFQVSNHYIKWMIQNPALIKDIKKNLLLYIPEIQIDSIVSIMLQNKISDKSMPICIDRKIKVMDAKKIEKLKRKYNTQLGKQSLERATHEFSPIIYYNQYAIIARYRYVHSMFSDYDIFLLSKIGSNSAYKYKHL